MSTPFDYVNGQKLDLSRDDHRQVVIHRNRELENAIAWGLPFHEVKSYRIASTVVLTCLKCGSDCEATYEAEFIHWDYDHRPSITCECCGTQYHYHDPEQTYDIKLKDNSNER